MRGPSLTLLDGEARHELHLDPDRFEVLEPRVEDPSEIGGNDLGLALSVPVESPPLEEIVDPGERVLIVVPVEPDPFGAGRLAALLVLRLLDLGAAAEEISILASRGTRVALSDWDARTALGDAIPAGLNVRGHDPDDRDRMVAVGTTSYGTPIEVNRLVLEADHVLSTGSIGFHVLEGFHGGRDAIVPAVASAETIVANRSLARDPSSGGRRTGVGPGRLDGNLVHEDMEEAAREVALSFIVNATRHATGAMASAYAGDWRHAHRRGCAEYSAVHGLRVDARRPIAIVSAGPLGDGDLGSAHAAAESAAGVVEEGGTIVVATGNLGGPSAIPADFPSARTSPELWDRALAGWGLRNLSRRFRLVLVGSADPAALADVGAEVSPSLELALETTASAEGYVVPAALTTLPYVAPAPPERYTAEDWDVDTEPL